MPTISRTARILSLPAFSVLLCGALLCGCTRPEAGFTAPMAEYKAGDTIRVSNTSKGAERLEWFFNDKQVGTEQDLVLPIPPGTAAVSTLTLKMYSGDDLYLSTHTIAVSAPAGTITAWGTFEGIQVTQVEGELGENRGTTTGGHSEDPGCKAEGAVSFVVEPGTYTIDGLSEVTRTRRVVEVSDGECVRVKLH